MSMHHNRLIHEFCCIKSCYLYLHTLCLSILWTGITYPFSHECPSILQFGWISSRRRESCFPSWSRATMSNKGARLHELHCTEDVWEYRGVSFRLLISYYITKWWAFYEWIKFLHVLICCTGCFESCNMFLYRAILIY